MNQLLSRMAPSITNMIRMDHTHVFTTFHQYQADTSARVKKGLADTVCVALEIHAQLEEEIFYPALRTIADNDFMRKGVPEHDQMRRLITQLRNLDPGHANYDAVGAGSLVMGAGALLACSYLLARPMGTRRSPPKYSGTVASR